MKIYSKTNVFFFDIYDAENLHIRNQEPLTSKSVYRLHHALAYGMIGCILSEIYGVSTNNICIRKNEYGKPFLYPQHKNVIINISHSGTIVAVSVSDKNIGIDIEKVVPMKNDIQCYNDYFTRTEIDIVDSADRKSEMFTVLWTRKEAALKYRGDGIEKISECSCFDKRIHSFLINSMNDNRYAFSYKYNGGSVGFYRYSWTSINKLLGLYQMIANNGA